MQLRPQDVALALRLAVRPDERPSQRALAGALFLSASEVNHGLARLTAARLFDPHRGAIDRRALLNLVVHGVRFVYPVQLGLFGSGMPTAYAASPLASQLLLDPDDRVVWETNACAQPMRGRTIDPLYPGAPRASALDPKLYECLALVDAIRVGRVRERKLAAAELAARLS